MTEPTLGREPAIDVRHLRVDGRTWRYEICGDGDEMVLMFTGGFGEGGPHELMRTLARRCRVIAPDYPPVRGIDDLVRSLREVVDHEGGGRVHLFGASLGGAIAQCYVRRYPEHVASIVLANTSGPVWWAVPIWRFVRCVFFVMPFPVIKFVAKYKAIAILRARTAEQRLQIDAMLKERFDSGLTKGDLCGLLRWLDDFHQRRFTNEDLSGWEGRILILESNDDPGVPKPCREQLKRLYPRARVHMFDGGGHAPSLSHREEFFEVLKRFFQIE